MAEPILQICSLSKSFGGVAANVDISFDVAPGEILGLIGPNGAGKSSLFASIAGAVTPDRGASAARGTPNLRVGAGGLRPGRDRADVSGRPKL